MYHLHKEEERDPGARDLAYYDTLSLSRQSVCALATHNGDYSVPNLRLKTKRLCEKSARRALRLRYVGASSSRVRLATPAGWPIATHHPVVPSPLFPSATPPSLELFSPRRVSVVPAPPTRPSLSSQSMASLAVGAYCPTAPVNWSPAPSFAPQQTSPL